MSWHVTRFTESVHVEILTFQDFSRTGPPQSIIGLHPGNVGRDVPVGENPIMVLTFLNQFVKAEATILRRTFGCRVAYTPSKNSGGAVSPCMFWISSEMT